MRHWLMTVLVALCASCATPKVQEYTLSPAIQEAWIDIRANAELSGMVDTAVLEQWDTAVENSEFEAMDFAPIREAAFEGIEMRLEAGKIGPNGAIVLRSLVITFENALEELRTPVIVVRPRRDYSERPLVISRSSWATNPPSAIAARTYR